MIEINLKELLEELQKREVQSDNNDHTQFKSIQTLFEQIQNNRGQVGLEELHYNLHFHREQSKILDKYLMKKDPKKIVKINKDYRKNKKQQSDTDSLSIVKDSVPQVKFMESLQWFQYLGQNEKIFQSQIFNRNYIIFQQLDNQKQFEDFSNLIIDKGENTVVYSGVDLLEISHIAIKQTLVINDFLEHAQQYIIQNEIYELYPNIFLKIILPVYIHSISQEKALFVSQMELGTINLFEYAQEHKIRDEEYQLIFQQIYIQITMLHHHKIAHRDIKPQNIIFVNNKGWLLCDFGEALKYEKQQSVYNIRGTFGFIPPRIYQASKIGDVLVQQDLLYNDLYALGITLLVIKHQIKKSSEIDDYLDKQDEIIQKLVENTKLKQLDQFQIDENQQFIEPNVKKSKQIDFQQLGNKEIMEYINVLKNIDFESPPPFLEKLIKFVDNYLVKIESDRLNYLYICQHIYQCPEYLKYFHNIPKFKMLRQVKFWRQKNKQINLVDQEQLISFMNQLGFIDLVLQFGYQYLTQKYSFSVHIIIIKTLYRLIERDRALNEYKLLLKFRDQYFMNDDELKLLIQISVLLLDFRFINQGELKYLAERNCVVSRFDLHYLEIDYDNSEEFLVEQIMSQYNSQKKKGKFISEYNIDQINIQTLRQQMIDLYFVAM
ncbi:hypothetical protein pb186bvf_001757 [Paramecium bursaria]